VLELLKAAGADALAQGREYVSPIHVFAAYCRTEPGRALLDRLGLAPDAIDRYLDGVVPKGEQGDRHHIPFDGEVMRVIGRAEGRADPMSDAAIEWALLGPRGPVLSLLERLGVSQEAALAALSPG
jgi:hypothetical protein